MLIVQKYGGSSLADTGKLFLAAKRVTRLAQQGAKLVVVVSAQGDTTDDLIARAAAVNPRGSAREMDAFLSAGEQMSASLMAMAIGALGFPAVSLAGWQMELMTDGVYGNARILGLAGNRILRELEQGKIVVATGFQGLSPQGDITTLGRGGSDTTAVALAAFLHAQRCQIFTDVDGVYDRDPRRYSGATRFGRLTYEKMLALIQNGAQVLHDRSVELARDHNMEIEVLSSATGAPGTLVGPD